MAESEERNLSVIEIEDLSAELIRKNIKNLHLRIYPPDGRIVITAPMLMRESRIRRYAEEKMPWIKKQLNKFEKLEREPERLFSDGELHYLWGRAYALRIEETGRRQGVRLDGDSLVLSAREGADSLKRKDILYSWYRKQLKEAVPEIISCYEERMNVRVNSFGIKKMKTRWGTCNIAAGRIWINLELAKRAPEYLEYLIVHEMCHLLECSHGKRFKGFMDRYLPDWRRLKTELNNFPLCNSDLYSRG